MRLLLLDRRALENRFGEKPDLSPLRALGELIVFEESSPLESFDRVKGADVVLTVSVPVSRPFLDWAPRVRHAVLLGGSESGVDDVAASDLGVTVTVAGGSSVGEVIAAAAEAVRREYG